MQMCLSKGAFIYSARTGMIYIYIFIIISIHAHQRDVRHYSMLPLPGIRDAILSFLWFYSLYF